MRSLSQSIFKIGFFSNKWAVFGLTVSVVFIIAAIFIEGLASRLFMEEGLDVTMLKTLNLPEFLVIVLLCSSVLWAGELYKYHQRRKLKA